jgi:NADPH-dependent glutamate synthase beta subunit-like oxidoreductase
MVAEQVLATGKADLISMGRQSLSDPFTPNKAMEGRFDEIRTCIACHQGCVGKLMKNQPIECILNPTVGKEYCTEIKRADQIKNVAVVGAGPAGLEAAIIAAQRGHNITVFERSSHVGGQLRLAAIPPSKGEIAGYIAWQMNELKKLNVEVITNAEVNDMFFDDKNFDEIIIATGADPIIPSKIPGINSSNVVSANDVLSGAVNVGLNIVVIGGGQVGTEVANHLGVQLKNVSVIEMREGLALEEEIVPRWGLLSDLVKNKVNQFTDTAVTEITENSVKIVKANEEMELPADAVVIAIGSKSNNRLAEELKGKNYRVNVIGDALKVGQAGKAIGEGFIIGNGI